MTPVQLIPVARNAGGSPGRVNLFIHGYRALTSRSHVEAAADRIRRSGVRGESYLVVWAAGRWRDAAAIAGLRAAYRVARFKNVLAPWMLLVDAGVVGLAEVAQFKFMERRAERVGRELPGVVESVAAGRPVNLVGHSLGGRVIHHALASTGMQAGRVHDCVLLAGAADLGAADWPDCLAKIDGRLYNAYSPGDRILKITPDLRRRVGGRAMPPIKIDGAPKVVNHRLAGVSHNQSWAELDRLLPEIWPGC